jgi:hypothetical protein
MAEENAQVQDGFVLFKFNGTAPFGLANTKAIVTKEMADLFVERKYGTISK